MKQKNINKRDGFTFFNSVQKAINKLNDKQLATFMREFLSVQFLEKRWDEVEFKDPLLDMMWVNMVNTVEAQINGYLVNKIKSTNQFMGVYDISNPPSDAPSHPPLHEVQGEVQVQDKVKGQEQEIITTESYDDSLRLSNYLFNNILKVNPNFKKPNLDTWAKDIDKAIRIDKRTVEQLKECIDWIYTEKGAFWQKNILSGKKLREKFDTMNMQVITKVSTKQELKLSEEAQVWANVYRKQGMSEEDIIEKLREAEYIV